MELRLDLDPIEGFVEAFGIILESFVLEEQVDQFVDAVEQPQEEELTHDAVD